mmetsp:Transcript_22230/g.10656  ORF Transcript_22230/g.10656 Transcript_22230/m.10656 type:complete len:98 (-) Transcript_22230:2900-3193(-)
MCRKNLAGRLLAALGAENERWGKDIEELDELLKVVVGDVLLAAAFVSYVGPFTKRFRDKLVTEVFMTFLKDNNIPMSENPNPLEILTNDAIIAKWNN